MRHSPLPSEPIPSPQLAFEIRRQGEGKVRIGGTNWENTGYFGTLGRFRIGRLFDGTPCLLGFYGISGSNWRRGWDLNPRCPLGAHSISSAAP